MPNANRRSSSLRRTAASVVLGLIAMTALEDAVAAQTTPDALIPPLASSLYKPPVPDAPPARVGGVSRGIGNVSVRLVVVAPNHTGFTSHDQPVLYWYSSNPVNARIEITVTTEDAVDPILETTVSGVDRAGIQSISLAAHGVRLALDTEYRWHVALIADAEHRSKDIIASGAIRRIALTPELAASQKGRTSVERARLYAENGLWYDAIETARNAETDPQQNLFEKLILEAGLDISIQ